MAASLKQRHPDAPSSQFRSMTQCLNLAIEKIRDIDDPFILPEDKPTTEAAILASATLLSNAVVFYKANPNVDDQKRIELALEDIAENLGSDKYTEFTEILKKISLSKMPKEMAYLLDKSELMIKDLTAENEDNRNKKLEEIANHIVQALRLSPNQNNITEKLVAIRNQYDVDDTDKIFKSAINILQKDHPINNAALSTLEEIFKIPAVKKLKVPDISVDIQARVDTLLKIATPIETNNNKNNNDDNNKMTPSKLKTPQREALARKTENKTQKLQQFENQIKEATVNYCAKAARGYIEFFTLDNYIDFCKESKPAIDLSFITKLPREDREQLESKFNDIVELSREKGASLQIRKLSNILANLVDGFAQLAMQMLGKSREQKIAAQSEELLADIKKRRPQ